VSYPPTFPGAAAGFHIGWALAFPGQLSRMDALVASGRRAAVVMAGVVVIGTDKAVT